MRRRLYRIRACCCTGISSTCLLIGALLTMTLLAGCNVYRFQERRLTHRFTRAGVGEQVVTLPLGQIRYWSGGAGRPVLLIHGFGGHALWQWHQQVGALIDGGSRVVAPDLAWFGETVPLRPSCSVAEQAAIFLELMDHLGIREFDVVGVSYGGYVAWRLAVEHPDRVRRLVLADSPGPAYEQGEYELMLERFGVESIEELLIPERPEEIRRLLRLAYARPPRVPGFALKSVHRELFTSYSAEKACLLADLRRSYRDRDSVARYPSQLTLILWGAEDRLFPVELAFKLKKSIGKHARVVTLPAAGHASNLERPVEFNRALVEFLTEAPAR